jgi:hypothetical protein
VSSLSNHEELIAAVAWDNYQGRTQALATALGGRAWYIKSRPSQKPLLPLRYAFDAVRTWRLLRRHRPGTLVAIAPPVGPPLIATLWCLAHPDCRLVVDCHTGAFHSWRWRWSTLLLRIACRRAVAALVHTEGDEALVRAWRGRALLLPDDIPDAALAAPKPRADHPCVVVAGSLDGNEPVAAALAAAALLPAVEFRFTGEVQRIPPSVRSAASPNVVFTGWLEYPEFLGELLAANVVAVFSTDPHIMNRAAFETIGVGRPLVLSDLPGLRARFGPAAMFSPNEPRAMAGAISSAIRQEEILVQRSVAFQDHLRAQHRQAVASLKRLLGKADPTTAGAVPASLRLPDAEVVGE